MRNIKTIFILVLSLILLLAVSCSNDDKTGETETTETIEIEEKDFPPDLLGNYTHSTSGCPDIQVFINPENGKIQMNIMFIRETDGYKQSHVVRIEKCTKTTKGGKIIKVEEEHGGYRITFDYETKTISGTYTAAGEKWSFSGTKK